MRLVLDTNVVVSALIWGGLPERLLEFAAEGQVTLFTSPVLLTELRDVLAREHLASRLRQQRGSVFEAIQTYAELAVVMLPQATPRVVPTDADDDHVVACAIAACAHLIVTGDRDLLVLKHYEGIQIVTVAFALAQLAR